MVIEHESYLYAIGEGDALRRSGGDAYLGIASMEWPPVEILRMLCGRNNEGDLIMDGTVNSSYMLKNMDLRPKTSAMANRTQGLARR